MRKPRADEDVISLAVIICLAMGYNWPEGADDFAELTGPFLRPTKNHALALAERILGFLSRNPDLDEA